MSDLNKLFVNTGSIDAFKVQHPLSCGPEKEKHSLFQASSETLGEGAGERRSLSPQAHRNFLQSQSFATVPFIVKMATTRGNEWEA